MVPRDDPRREAMIRRHLRGRGIADRRVLAAMAAVPRERFVPEYLADQAYDDAPLPIGHDQTISQPYIVALMTEAAGLTRRSRVLEVGTGTGYHTAVLATIAHHVWTIERLGELSAAAEQRLRTLKITNVTFVVGDGAKGFPPAAPYDAIVVAAAAPRAPPALLDQLAMGGRLVIPLGDLHLQELTIMRRTPDGVACHTAGTCRFVPLVSSEGFSSVMGDG